MKWRKSKDRQYILQVNTQMIKSPNELIRIIIMIIIPRMNTMLQAFSCTHFSHRIIINDTCPLFYASGTGLKKSWHSNRGHSNSNLRQCSPPLTYLCEIFFLCTQKIMKVQKFTQKCLLIANIY